MIDTIYLQIIVPSISTATDFITKITQDITAWFEDATLYSYRFINIAAQDSIAFVNNLTIEVTDWVKHYSTVLSQIVVAALSTAALSLFKTLLDIPFWVNEVIVVSLAFLSSLFGSIKKGVIQVYDDLVSFVNKIIDVAPFLVRYEEEGETKVSLTPTAQMLLYIASTIYALQPLLEQNSGSRYVWKKLYFDDISSFFTTSILNPAYNQNFNENNDV